MDITIRLEEEGDRRAVEELTKRAFWNLYVPGCDEHYLAHVMRSHPDFIPELDFVAELDGKVVGSIMYTKSRIVRGAEEVATATFGPLCVEPRLQRKGVGTMLVRRTVALAREAGYPAIIIYGNPGNYVKHGFRGSKKLGIGDRNGDFPCALLVLPLRPEAFPGGLWRFEESPVYELDQGAVAAYDAGMPFMEKGLKCSQEEFSILSNAFLR